MTNEHATAICAVLSKSSARLEFNGNPKGGQLASEIQQAREGIERAIKMIKIVTKSEVKPL